MKMRMKNVRLFALMLAVLSFAACEEEEVTTGGGGGDEITNGGGETGGNPAEPGEPVSSGVLIVNQGNEASNPEGDFTTVDYANGYAATTGRFWAVNGRSLGMTPNRSCIHGGKIYTAVTTSNIIEVCRKSDFQSVTKIALAGNETLSQPRDVVGLDGYVYVSLYSGHVCKIDTTDFSIVGTVAVGLYPEDMAIANGRLYVPNSNYGAGTTVSEIDLASFTKTRDITVPVNPVKMETDASGNVYLLCSGEYESVPPYSQVGAAVWRLDLSGGNHVKVADATLMDIPAGTNTLYVVNSPYGATSVTYASVDLTQSTYTPVSLSLSADSPAGIAADPVNGNIVLTSYNLEGGWASYNTPGYANIYDAAGTLLRKVETGIGPCAIYFFTEHVD